MICVGIVHARVPIGFSFGVRSSVDMTRIDFMAITAYAEIGNPIWH